MESYFVGSLAEKEEAEKYETMGLCLSKKKEDEKKRKEGFIRN